MECKMRTGECDVLATNTVITFDSTADLTIDVTADNGFTFTIKLIFSSDENLDNKSVNSKTEDNNTAVFENVNFSNVLGTGITKAIEFGNIDGRKLYILYHVIQAAANAPRIVTYSIFVERR